MGQTAYCLQVSTIERFSELNFAINVICEMFLNGTDDVGCNFYKTSLVYQWFIPLSLE